MSRSLLTNETSELDLLDQRPFDQTDFDILKSYEAVVDGLAIRIAEHFKSCSECSTISQWEPMSIANPSTTAS